MEKSFYIPHEPNETQLEAMANADAYVTNVGLPSYTYIYALLRMAIVRAALSREFGADKYRITSIGEIYVYGEMPNCAKTDWYFYGHLDDSHTMARIDSLN